MKTKNDIEQVKNYQSVGLYKRISLENKSELINNPLWYHEKGLMQTASGYGSKLTTEYSINFEGKKRRVYCHIFSNCGTLYIIYKGEKIVIDV